jgi:hypothetical protein
VPTGSGTGTLLITSDPPGATVYLDGEYKGVTPLGYTVVFAGHDPDNIFILTGIPVGPHQLTFTKEGYKDYRTSVTLKNGEYKYVPAILVQISPDPTPTVIPTTVPTRIPTGTGTGTLSIKSYPSVANVYLDGEWKGVTPEWSGPGYAIAADDTPALSLTGIPAGPHQLKVTKEGFPDYVTSVTVTGGETTSVNAILTQLPPDSTPTINPTAVPTELPTGTGTVSLITSDPRTGSLFITTNPRGAKVYLDGEWKGGSGGYPRISAFIHDKNPLILTGIPAGPHQLKVTAEGYQDYSESVTLKGREIKYITAILVQISPDPTPMPTTIPTTGPTPAPSTPAPSHTPCPPGMPWCSVFW